MTDRLRLRNDVVVVRDGPDLVVVTSPEREPVAIPAPVLAAVVQAFTDRPDVTPARLVEAVGASLGLDAGDAEALVGRVRGLLLAPSAEPVGGSQYRVALIGSGELAEFLRVEAQAAGFDVRAVPAATATALVEDLEDDVVMSPLVEPGPSGGAGARSVPLAGCDAAVCALENVQVRSQLAVQAACDEAGVACVFVTGTAEGVDVGPTRTGPASAGPLEARQPRPRGRDVRPKAFVPPVRRRLLPWVANEVTGELARLSRGAPSLVDRVRRARADRDGPSAAVSAEELTLATSDAGAGTGALADEPTDRLLAAVHQQWPAVPVAGWSGSSRAVRTVGVLGGGTAGYLTAMAVRAVRPEVDVTLIESASVRVIGVGEATTSEFPPFLHRILGLDIGELYQRVQPTWKLGIRFQWNDPVEHFNYAFDFGRPLEAWTYDGHLREVTLLSTLMERGAGLVVGDEPPTSLLATFPHAYHLDNERFVAYLQQVAPEAGVRRLDRLVVDVALGPNGDRVDALVTDRGERLSFDFYVDCSGFRAELIERRLGSRFVSYADSLATDRAIVADVPHDGAIKPYTTAEFMDHGWCWSIPMGDCDHRGYVHASSFVDEDDAVAEMRRRNPQMGDHWTVNFRSGRHEDFVIGNVAAVGNAYGFVEPLESTALVATVWQAMLLAQHLPDVGGEPTKARTLNREVAGMWDYLRGFLAVHYRFNRGYDTPFWKWCQNEVDLAGAEEIVELWREGAPLVYQTFGRAVDRHLGGVVFSNFGFDMMLFGLGLHPDRVRDLRETEAQFRRRMAACGELARRCLPAAASLSLVTGARHDLLAQAAEPSSWMGAFEQFMRDGSWTPQGGIYR